MYYTDITNSELAYFHNRPVHNFTAKLTDVLSSDLFQIEEIITNSIYKIYPLFYTNEITSSNSNDKILENKCIICQKLEDETYLTFKSNDGEIIDFTDYGTYYNIGDSLTMAQFNAYISLLRQNITHSDEIHIKEEVTGTYGTYQFDITGATLIDTGLVITDETIQAQPKVKLTDNVFSNSNYILRLDVIHYTGANILDDTTSDYKVVDTIELELIPDEWVNIPVETLQQDYIISLNATVDIDHKKPIIYIPDYELTLTSDKDIIQTDETANLTATLTLDGEPLTGETVTFKVYKASDDTLVETLTGTTNSQGIATVSYVGKGAGSLNIKAGCMNLTKTYVLYDAIWYDSNSAIWNVSNGTTTYSNNARSITLNANTGLANPSVDNQSYFIPCTDDFIVEFDYSGGNMSLYFAISGQAYNMGISLNFAKYNNKTLKLVVKPSEDKTDVYIDGVYDNTVTNSRSFATSETCALYIRTNNSSGATGTFGNLKIYPI